jgi:TPR repeat protein
LLLCVFINIKKSSLLDAPIMNIKKLFIFLLSLLTLPSCVNTVYEGHISEEVINWKEINTPYNDYNSSLFTMHPYAFTRYNLFLSTDRHNQPAGHRIHYFKFNILFDRKRKPEEGKIETRLIENKTENTPFPLTHHRAQYAPNFLINSLLWPSSKSLFFDVYNVDPYALLTKNKGWLYFAGETKDKSLDIFYSEALDSNLLGLISTYPYGTSEVSHHKPNSKTQNTVYSAKRINSSADDAYITFGPDHQIIFSSNRYGRYNIMSTKVPKGMTPEQLPTWLNDESNDNKIQAITSLNSPFDDNAPFVFDDWMVFTSNRPGGKGGYDLYLSQYSNGYWQTPKLIPNVNTKADEFRPILVKLADLGTLPKQLIYPTIAGFKYDHFTYKNHLLIFSSNRLGGKGGFDLYRTGINLTKPADSFNYYKAEVLFHTHKNYSALEYLNKYITKTNGQGKYHENALSMIDSAKDNIHQAYQLYQEANEYRKQKKFNTAIPLYKKSARLGNPFSQAILTEFYQQGLVVEKDIVYANKLRQLALESLIEMAIKDNIDALYALGIIYNLSSHRYFLEHAKELLGRASNQGNPWASYYLANFHQHLTYNFDSHRTNNEIMRLYSKAIAKGIMEAKDALVLLRKKLSREGLPQCVPQCKTDQCFKQNLYNNCIH